jgi:hypothetical protein
MQERKEEQKVSTGPTIQVKVNKKVKFDSKDSQEESTEE